MGLFVFEHGCCCSLEIFGYLVGYLNLLISGIIIIILVLVLLYLGGVYVYQLVQESADPSDYVFSGL